MDCNNTEQKVAIQPVSMKSEENLWIKIVASYRRNRPHLPASKQVSSEYFQIQPISTAIDFYHISITFVY